MHLLVVHIASFWRGLSVKMLSFTTIVNFGETGRAHMRPFSYNRLIVYLKKCCCMIQWEQWLLFYIWVNKITPRISRIEGKSHTVLL